MDFIHRSHPHCKKFHFKNKSKAFCRCWTWQLKRCKILSWVSSLTREGCVCFVEGFPTTPNSVLIPNKPCKQYLYKGLHWEIGLIPELAYYLHWGIDMISNSLVWFQFLRALALRNRYDSELFVSISKPACVFLMMWNDLILNTVILIPKLLSLVANVWIWSYVLFFSIHLTCFFLYWISVEINCRTYQILIVGYLYLPLSVEINSQTYRVLIVGYLHLNYCENSFTTELVFNAYSY